MINEIVRFLVIEEDTSLRTFVHLEIIGARVADEHGTPPNRAGSAMDRTAGAMYFSTIKSSFNFVAACCYYFLHERKFFLPGRT